MLDPSEIAGDVISGGSALAGLILVYLGSVATGYSSFSAVQQPSVKVGYQRRAWFAFSGFVIAILSVGCALFGKWMDADWLSISGAVLLLISLTWSVITALFTALEVS
jgi:hypothetical protein